MGQDAAAVTDERLRVRGFTGLRVIDASIMPAVVSGNTNAATIMIGEKGAAMIREELGYDPRAGSAEFDANVRMAVERETWWVGEFEQRLCFYCSEGPYSARTLQAQGIWTPPELRRRGLGARALFGICDRLLKEHPTISLYVNDFNAAGLALYKALGFSQVAEFTTLLF